MALFVGRDGELGVLTATFKEVRDGHPRQVLVSGEAGVGKSRLVEHFATILGADEVTVLAGVCVELEGLPLAPVTSILRKLVRDGGPEVLADVEELRHLLPELAPPDEQFPAPGRLLDLLTVLLQRQCARRPVLLVVEDLHWANGSTVELITQLARTVRDLPVMLVATCRSDDLPRRHPMKPLLAELGRVPSVRRIELRRFSRAETAELIADRLGEHPSADLVDLIFSRSDGNAFFAEEFLRHRNPADLPESVRDLLVGRIDRLPKAAQDVVKVVAVGGRQVPHQLVTQVAASTDVLGALRAAVDARVLVVEGDGYAFRHALVQDAAIRDLLAGERIALHHAYAEALERHPGLIPAERLAAALAHHWTEAGDFAMALPALLRAAKAAEAAYAYLEQYELLRRALAMWPRVPNPAAGRVDVLEQAVTAAWRCGQRAAALDLTDTALAETDRARAPEPVAVLLALRARLLLNLGMDGAIEAIAEAERLVPAGSSRARALVLITLGTVRTAQGSPVAAREACQEAVRIASELGDVGLELGARTTVGLALSHLGRHDEAIAELNHARWFAQTQGEPNRLVRIHVNLSLELWAIGRYDEAIEVADTGIHLARRVGQFRTFGGQLTTHLGMALLASGRWAEVDQLLAAGLPFDPPDDIAAYLHQVEADLAVYRGKLAEAVRHLSRTELSARQGNRYRQRVAEFALPRARLTAEVALAEDRIDDARQAVTEVLELTEVSGQATAFAWPLLTTASRVEALRRQRDRVLGAGPTDVFADAITAAAAKLSLDAPPWRACHAQFAAELASDTDSWEQAANRWEEAGVPYSAAYARFRAAEAALATKHRTAAAADVLRGAAREATRLAARPLLRDIERLARRAHVELDDPSPGQRLRLTSREEQVLRLLADGRSNRQIAEELFITEKTASAHVSRVLTKLGVSNRGEAAATAHRLRLFESS